MLPAGGALTVDIASTGGPSSLSTLICPLFLRACGCIVPKLGVPGRPAGGVDILATIPGYTIRLDSRGVQRCLEECGYSHFLAASVFAPLDAKLFRFRQLKGAQSHAPFVIASILAKKIAVGVSCAGLDVRVAQHGNFGSKWEDAEESARRFCRISALCGITSTCFLTDGMVPYQPYIGRGEALTALWQVFADAEDRQLTRHVDDCWFMASSMTAGDHSSTRPTRAQLKAVFDDNLRSQGSNWSHFQARVEAVLEEPAFEVTASDRGHLVIDLRVIRDTFVELQDRVRSATIEFADPGGLRLLAASGDWVEKGQPVGVARGPKESHTALAQALTPAFRYTPTPVEILRKRPAIISYGSEAEPRHNG